MAEWRLRSAAVEAPKEQAPAEVPVSAGFLDNWKGQLEVGASRSTGRTSYLGALGSVSLEQDGPRWRNKINARLEVQKGRNVTDVERVVASWQPNYKFDESLYTYGLAQIEVDSSQDYRRRYTAGGGVGYGIFNTQSAKLDLEGGPAFRRAHPVLGEARSSLAARASVNFKWAITPTLELKQASALFLEPGNRNATTMTSFDAQVLGPLKARFSYDVRYEDQPGQSGRHLDTLSRATLVYSF
jgi:putative salt-induced outer membrane protein